MKKFFPIALAAIFPLTAQAVTTTVPAGNIVDGGDVNSVVTQKVYGQTNNFTISGVQQVMNGGITYNSNLYPYGQQDVMQGGTSYNTNVQSYAVQNINGKSYNSAVSTRGIIDVNAGGYAESTTVNGGSYYVSAGATSEKTIINSGNHYISGTDNNSTLNNGTQTVRNGGIANKATINNGTQQIEIGGKSNGTVIKGGSVRVFGQALNNTVYGGRLNILSDGYAKNTTVNGGTMEVNNSGTSEYTNIISGQQRLYGTDNYSTVSGGTQSVRSGGTAKYATVTGQGIQQISGSGISENTTVTDGGTQLMTGGSAYNTTVTSGGNQQISDGASAYNTTISNFGIQYLNNSGNAFNTVIKSQGIQQIVSGGTATDSQVYNNGLLTVGNGGITQNTTVFEKGAIWIYKGGTAENTLIDNGGWMTLNGGGILSGQTQINNGNLTIIGSNTIPDLTLNNTMVYLTPAPQFSELTVNNLNGSGRFYISSNIAANKSDQIIIQGGKGNFGLVIHDYSHTTKFPDQFSVIDEKSGASDRFYLVGGAVNVGAYEYNLEEKGGDWYLVKTQELNDSSYVAKNAFLSLRSVFETHTTSLDRQLQSLHFQNKHDNGLWIRTFGRKIKDKFKDDANAHSDVFGTQIGYNHNLWQNNKHSVDVGIYGGYSFSRQKYSIDGKGTGYTNNIGLYSAYTNQNQYFIDIVGSYFWHHQKTTDYTPDGTDVIAKYDPHAWQTSINAGKRFNFADNWYIEPQIGLAYLKIDGTRYQTNFNTPVNTSDFSSLKSSIGFYAGRNMTISDNIESQIYGRFKIINYSDAKAWIEFADYTFEENMSSTGYELGLGINAAVKKNWAGYIDIGTHFGGKSTIPLEASLGLQYYF